MICKACRNTCIKNGFQANGRQRYYCKLCKLNQQKVYTYRAYKKGINGSIYKLLNGCSITDIARVLLISRNTVARRILSMAENIRKPFIYESQQVYEMDELCTKVNGKQCWVSYAINRKSKQVIGFVVGDRSNGNLIKVVNSLLCLNPKRIYTDSLINYYGLLPSNVHNNARYQTNRIERFNLNLRTHLKWLSRKTLCYSKSMAMLEACLRIYFWAEGCKHSNHVRI